MQVKRREMTPWRKCLNLVGLTVLLCFPATLFAQDHSCFGQHQVIGDILRKYDQLGACRSFLGSPLTSETATPDGQGRYNHFRGGSIYWHPKIGARVIHGAIRDKWASLGWERSFLGYPTTDETATPDGRGRYNHFQGGSIYWHPKTRAHEVHGAIRDKWASLGWERSSLGYPRTDEMTTLDGKGRVSRFQGGWIYWYPDTGARVGMPPGQRAINQAVEGFLSRHRVAGLSVAIAKDGQLRYAGGHGLADRENGIALDVDHRLRIGSISKSVTAVAIFRLIDNKATFGGVPLTLERKVFGARGILRKEVRVPSWLRALESATIGDFLAHNSGLPGAAPDAVQCTAGNLSKRIESVLRNHVRSLNGRPGTVHEYSNLGYIVLERVIEVVSKVSYENYVLREVFGPLGITSPRLFKIGPYVSGSREAKHYRADGSYAEYSTAGTCENKPPGVGSGGWAMSAKDLIQFLASVDGVGADLLPKGLRDSMVLGSGISRNYGKGWLLNGWGWCGTSRAIEQGHNGGLSGGFSNLFLLDNGVSFAVIGNQNTTTGFCSDTSNRACGGHNQPPCSDDSITRLLSVLDTL